jgi:hypothetical protein
MALNFKSLSLQEKASLFFKLMQTPGWELLKQSFRQEIRERIIDTDSREAFLYEAVRAQVLQEIFSAPQIVIRQAERERGNLASDSSKASRKKETLKEDDPS